MKKLIIVMLALFVTLACVACGRNPKLVQKGRIQQSKLSPNGHIEATIFLADTGEAFGATVSQPYQIYIRKTNISNSEKNVILNADKTDGFFIHWQESKLYICYIAANIYNFRNKFTLVNDDKISFEEVEIVLKKVNGARECYI